MNGRPKSEDPINLVADRLGYVCSAGYRWAMGTDSQGGVGQFLAPLSRKGRVGPVLEEAYLDFQAIDSPESALVFAGRHGRLGIQQEHFHVDKGEIAWGEPFGRWGIAIAEFQGAFRIWNLIAAGDEGALRKHIASDDGLAGYMLIHFQQAQERQTMSFVDSLLFAVVEEINMNIASRYSSKAVPPPCRVPGCHFAEPRKIVPFTGRVSYQLKFSATHSGAKVKPQIEPVNLKAAIWLQFSELVCGKRTIRQCEVCGEWMDVSQSAHKAAKRMHDRCGHASRMRRYRQKLKNGESEGGRQ